MLAAQVRDIGPALDALGAAIWVSVPFAVLQTFGVDLVETTDRGIAHTWDGFAASGRFFDITHGVDFLKADIETRVYQLFLNQEKVPFTATGLAQIESQIRAALSASEASGLITSGWSVTMPSLVGYSAVDKAARVLRTVRFTATLQGAVHSVTVAGTLTI